MRRTIALLLLLCQCSAFAAEEETFDVLASVMDTSQKQLNAKGVLKQNRGDAEAFREKIVAGSWEFMQASSGAKPGEYCAALFQRATHESKPDGGALFKDGVAVTLFGPGGSYRGALLTFSPLLEEHAFPKLKNGQKVPITLKQGGEPPQTHNALYMTFGASQHPMLIFAVPSGERLLDTIDDQARFELLYQGRPIVTTTWHSGFKARDALKACMKNAR